MIIFADALVWALVLRSVLGAPLETLVGLHTPLSPEDDEFYVPEPAYEEAGLGTVLKWRELKQPVGFGLFRANVHRVLQMQYRTSGAMGNALAAVATVIVPHSADLSKVVSYQIAEDSSWLGCCTSFLLQLKPNLAKSGVAEFLFMDVLLQHGWVVLTPDHEGPDAAFAANKQGGQLVLDGLRAVMTNPELISIEIGAQAALMGYSGGAMVTGWAAELQPAYYPDLNLVGTVVGGLIPDMRAILTHVNRSMFSGFLPAAIYGMCSAYPEAQAMFEQKLLPDHWPDLEKIRSQCVTENLIDYADIDVFTWFQDGEQDFLHNNTVFGQVLDDNSLLKHVPSAPMLMYHSKNDEVAPFGPAKTAFHWYCDQGVSVQMHVDRTTDHLVGALTGFPRAVRFLEQRFSGLPVDVGCQYQEHHSNLLSPKLWTGEYFGFKSIVRHVLGQPMGVQGGLFSLSRYLSVKE